jgi:transcriptional regulator with XRE-family HTH domain
LQAGIELARLSFREMDITPPTRARQTYGDRLRRARLNSGLTQAQAAKIAGISLRSYLYYESGQREPMPAKYWQAMPSAEGILADLEQFCESVTTNKRA